jgi:hypothetical protein
MVRFATPYGGKTQTNPKWNPGYDLRTLVFLDFSPLTETFSDPMLGHPLYGNGSAMNFILQPWQLFHLILAGWVNHRQQLAIDYLRTENHVSRKLTEAGLPDPNVFAGAATFFGYHPAAAFSLSEIYSLWLTRRSLAWVAPGHSRLTNKGCGIRD